MNGMSLRTSVRTLEPRYYKHHLAQVSRSFAFCIEELKSDLQSHVALAYLLFRVLDTIEDAEWQDPELQRKSFALFSALITEKEKNSEFFVQTLLQSKMNKKEEELLRESQALFDALAALDSKTKKPLVLALKTMSAGMEYFALEKKHQIQNIAELNLYCYFVAGCIGELLSEWTFRDDQKNEVLFEKAIHFGLFLQKINILKDFQDDSKAGRSFLWSWQEVAESLQNHAVEAFDYVQEIPQEKSDYKIFCAWSLFLGLLSYPSIEKSLKNETHEKISRLEAWKMLSALKKEILQEKNLSSRFEKLLKEIPEGFEIPPFDRPSLLQKIHPLAEQSRLKNFHFA